MFACMPYHSEPYQYISSTSISTSTPTFLTRSPTQHLRTVIPSHNLRAHNIRTQLRALNPRRNKHIRRQRTRFNPELLAEVMAVEVLGLVSAPARAIVPVAATIHTRRRGTAHVVPRIGVACIGAYVAECVAGVA
jgi:hypothetical protein